MKAITEEMGIHKEWYEQGPFATARCRSATR